MSAGPSVRDLVIADLTHTCLACPSQWEGRLADGRPLYIRYRWGRLRVRLGVHGDELLTMMPPGADSYDGFLELDEVLALTGLTLAAGVVVKERWND